MPLTANSVWWGQQYRRGGMQQALRVMAYACNSKHTRRPLYYVRARKAARALHSTRHSKQQKTKKRKKGAEQRRAEKNREEEDRRKKNREQRTERVVLDGGGARLADAATRHHLTQTTKEKRKERRVKRRKRGEQNKHTRTQTIQKTSTRTSPSHGHHTLPSMRNQTPIPQ